MYLKSLESSDPPKAAGRYGRVIKKMHQDGKAPPGIYYLFAQRPEAAKHLGSFMQEIMRGPSELDAGDRELIAAWTSARNDCLF